MTMQDSRVITYGVIGCGMMGQEHLRNIALLPGTAIGAIFEPTPPCAPAPRRWPPVRAWSTAWPTCWRIRAGLPADRQPDHRHVEQLQAVAAHRPLPVLVEKPLFTQASDAAAVAELAARHAAPVWVAMEYRYMPPVARLLEMAQEATGGIRMLSIREHRYPFLSKVGQWNRFNRYSGGTFVEKCCHFFDLMRLALGSDPVRVMATGGQALNHLDEVHDGRTPDIFDTAIVAVDFADGTRAMLELCACSPKDRAGRRRSAPWPPRQDRGLCARSHALLARASGRSARGAGRRVAPRTPRAAGPRDPRGPDAAGCGGSQRLDLLSAPGFLELVRGQRDRPDVTSRTASWAVRMGLAAQTAMIERRVVEL